MGMPRRGQKVCKAHGGNIKRSLKAAERRAEEEEVRNVLAAFDDTAGEDVDPYEAYFQLIAASHGKVAYLARKVKAVRESGELTWGTTEVVEDEERGTRATERAGANIWLKLYDEERDRLHELIRDAHRMGIEERMLELAKALGSQLLQHLANHTDKILEWMAANGFHQDDINDIRSEVWDATITETLASVESGAPVTGTWVDGREHDDKYAW